MFPNSSFTYTYNVLFPVALVYHVHVFDFSKSLIVYQFPVSLFLTKNLYCKSPVSVASTFNFIVYLLFCGDCLSVVKLSIFISGSSIV